MFKKYTNLLKSLKINKNIQICKLNAIEQIEHNSYFLEWQVELLMPAGLEWQFNFAG